MRPSFEGRILAIDDRVVLRCARLRVPDPCKDALIAATALVHGMPVVTRDSADFVPTSVPLPSPWAQAGDRRRAPGG